MLKRVLSVASILTLFGIGLATMSPAGAQATTTFTVDKVLVNKTGGITVTGTVDCSAVVAEAYPSGAPPNTTVVVNVSWTANQASGRKLVTAHLEDTQASPCWANTAEFLEPGRCIEQSPGVWAACRWDSSNWGSDGYVYGNGTFKPGGVHVETMLTGVDPPFDTMLYEMRSFTLRAKKA